MHVRAQLVMFFYQSQWEVYRSLALALPGLLVWMFSLLTDTFTGGGGYCSMLSVRPTGALALLDLGR